MRRIAQFVTTAFIAAAAVPAAAHGPDGGAGYGPGHYRGGADGHGGMMERMHDFAGRGGPGMMGGGDFAPGMMQGPGQMGFGMMGMGQFGMSLGMADDMDENGDGVISPSEARAARTARLEEFDADGDGNLSIAEFETLHSAAIREMMVDRFQYLDADGNGEVTAEEMNAPVERMSRFMRMQNRSGAGRENDDDGDRPARQRQNDDDMPRGGMNQQNMPGMGGGQMSQ